MQKKLAGDTIWLATYSWSQSLLLKTAMNFLERIYAMTLGTIILDHTASPICRCPLLGHVTNGEDPDFEKEVGGAEGRLGSTAAGLQWTWEGQNS
jgi:hypothetical protein